MLKWLSTLLWAVANVIVGCFAILPLGLGTTLLVHLQQGLPPAGTNHVPTSVLGRPTLFEVDGDEIEVAAAIVLVTLLVLGILFALVNAPFRRRLPAGVARAVWPVACTLALAPFLAAQLLAS